jgi:hypothetical protein
MATQNRNKKPPSALKPPLTPVPRETDLFDIGRLFSQKLLVLLDNQPAPPSRKELVGQTMASWNQIIGWLQEVNLLRASQPVLQPNRLLEYSTSR